MLDFDVGPDYQISLCEFFFMQYSPETSPKRQWPTALLEDLNKFHDQSQRQSDVASDLPLFLQRSSIPNATAEAEPAASTAVAPLPNISGMGEPYNLVAYANSVRLQGRTNARFSNSFAIQNVVTTAATDCDGCVANQCIHAVGILQSTFQVVITVTLPQVADFPTLTPCQQTRVQNAIDTVLAPHEQQHVAAFQTYIGIISTPFDLTLCRNNFNTAIRALHNSLEASRQSVAQVTSDALDPFKFDVDLNCAD